MNFYKHHLGDYDGATAHLSWDEDMAYTRLLRAYYRREKPIPEAEACRLGRASSKAQRAAVDRVLGEFFSKQDGFWHNKRADDEITAYQAQASTNRRISRQRTVNESSTKGIPNQEPLTKNQRSTKTPLSAAFAISDRVARWAEEKGILNLQAHFENFVGVARAKGYKYADWDEALIGAVRKDWAHLGNGQRKVAL